MVVGDQRMVAPKRVKLPGWVESQPKLLNFALLPFSSLTYSPLLAFVPPSEAF